MTSRMRLRIKLHRWHKNAGLAVAFITLLLITTGLALNHTDQLELDKTFIQSDALLDWYGIKDDPKPRWFETNHGWLGQANDQVFFNKTRLYQHTAPLIGAVSNLNFLLLAHEDRLVLVTPDAEIVEIQPITQMLVSDEQDDLSKPSRIDSVGIHTESSFVLNTDQGYYISHDELYSWKWMNENRVENITFSNENVPPAELVRDVQVLAKSHILPLERFLLDLHSGRFLGQTGVLLIDISGLAILFLTISGVWFWLDNFLLRKRR